MNLLDAFSSINNDVHSKSSSSTREDEEDEENVPAGAAKREQEAREDGEEEEEIGGSWRVVTAEAMEVDEMPPSSSSSASSSRPSSSSAASSSFSSSSAPPVYRPLPSSSSSSSSLLLPLSHPQMHSAPLIASPRSARALLETFDALITPRAQSPAISSSSAFPSSSSSPSSSSASVSAPHASSPFRPSSHASASSPFPIAINELTPPPSSSSSPFAPSYPFLPPPLATQLPVTPFAKPDVKAFDAESSIEKKRRHPQRAHATRPSSSLSLLSSLSSSASSFSSTTASTTSSSSSSSSPAASNLTSEPRSNRDRFAMPAPRAKLVPPSTPMKTPLHLRENAPQLVYASPLLGSFSSSSSSSSSSALPLPSSSSSSSALNASSSKAPRPATNRRVQPTRKSTQNALHCKVGSSSFPSSSSSSSAATDAVEEVSSPTRSLFREEETEAQRMTRNSLAPQSQSSSSMHNLPPSSSSSSSSSSSTSSSSSFSSSASSFLSVASDASIFATRFQILSTIGQGTFGIVYQVRSLDDGLLYAIKKMRKPFRSTAEKTRDLKEVLHYARLASGENQKLASSSSSSSPSSSSSSSSSHDSRLSSSIASLCSLSSVVLVYRAWVESNFLHIQSEFLIDGTLRDFLSSASEAIAEDIIWSWAAQLLLILEFLHRNKMLHLDVKPANIFRTRENRLKIGDLGTSVFLEEEEDGEKEEAEKRRGRGGAGDEEEMEILGQENEVRGRERELRSKQRVHQALSFNAPSSSSSSSSSQTASLSHHLDADIDEGDSSYIAPELLDRSLGPISPASDLFSLGLTLYEIAADVVLPTRGLAWSALRREQIDWRSPLDSPCSSCSPAASPSPSHFNAGLASSPLFSSSSSSSSLVGAWAPSASPVGSATSSPVSAERRFQSPVAPPLNPSASPVMAVPSSTSLTPSYSASTSSTSSLFHASSPHVSSSPPPSSLLNEQFVLTSPSFMSPPPSSSSSPRLSLLAAEDGMKTPVLNTIASPSLSFHPASAQHWRCSSSPSSFPNGSPATAPHPISTSLLISSSSSSSSSCSSFSHALLQNAPLPSKIRRHSSVGSVGGFRSTTLRVFIEKLLKRQPEQRATVKESLMHPNIQAALERFATNEALLERR